MAQEIVTNLVVKVVDSLFGKAKEEIGYMWNCSKNVEDLKKKNKELTLMMGRVQEKIRVAKENGDTLSEGVEDWVDEAKQVIDGAKADFDISEAKEVIEGANADSHISEAKEVIDGANIDSHTSKAKEVTDGAEANAKKTCFNFGMCVNLGTHYRYGKKVVEKVPLLEDQLARGQKFESSVSVPTRAPGVLDVYERHNIDGLDTHKRCFEEIMKSIEDEDIQIIGIYGMGGVGKTTLAKEVAVTVKSLNLYAAVEFITVSQPVDVARIKKEVEVAAKRIMKGEMVLVILDDVWEKLKLDDVCIPCGDRFKNCKILLTSRSKDVCETMNATRLISVESLKQNESWILFKRVVGDKVETDEKLNKIAVKVVGGCGGLPLIIQAVGAALKYKGITLWERALTQIQKHATPDIDSKIRLAYSHLQLSYNFLESEEAKSCFLLCSMFPEDYNIPLERLAYYGVGLKIFKDLEGMEDAGNGVRHAVQILKDACLLSEGDYESSVKMHDVVREVALLIASEGRNKFLVKAGKGLTEWQPRPESVKSCTGISLMKNRIEELPDYELEIPLLDIFLIQENLYLPTIPDKFIQGVKEARVLDFGDNGIVSLPSSLQQLTKLCMLNLGGNKSLCDISILGHLKSLEILILSYTGIEKIPLEIGDLVSLRRLEVKGCPRLHYIAPGVMSKLRWLEELHIDCGVIDGNYESLVEIGELSMLTFLDLFVPHIHLIPTEGVCFTKLKGFVIQIGGSFPVYHAAEVVHKKTLILGMKDLDKSSMLEVKELIKLSDGIIFPWVVNLNIVPCESLDDLTTIMLSKCPNLSRLEELGGGENSKKQFFSKLEHLLVGLDMLHVLWNCPDQYISLKNLVTLNIAYCKELVRLFSVSVAHRLVNLQTLTIQECSSLEEVIWDGDEGDIYIVVFPCLAKIELLYLHNLKRFCAGKVIIKCPSLVKVEVKGCNEMEPYDIPDLKLVNQTDSPLSPCIGTAMYHMSEINWKVHGDQVMKAVRK